MSVTIEQIKALRDATGISSSACKKALEEAAGDQKQAILILRKKGEDKAAKLQNRSTGQGIISSYVHTNNKIGVLVDIRCETDFVTKNDDFQEFSKDVAMHIAAMDPQYLTPEEVDSEIVGKEKEIWTEQLKNEGKPENIIENILKGKEKKFREENALLSQPFVKNPEITIRDLLKEIMTKVGENVKVERFVRFGI